MSQRQRYRRRPDRPVVAVRLLLDTEGFDYRKWGDQQHCKPGDWLVDSDGDIYTVDAATFERTYRSVGKGTYVKSTPVWAEASEKAGSVSTQEGRTHFAAGDFLVSNNEEGTDSYAIEAKKFHALYERDD
ncbi:hypothetical protein QTI24_24535 [Variovorax sp. J22P240]|uniref:hypothetical protein n=1 Tax=Variovorax sp. J22P240 TaxID=3053514 RepID=UPI002576508B|nr:hypothetical protein [Variovorax sp. J22P240]MDM0001798.1 hypothetical protein [Variovorax sp. J22P240]